MSLRNCSRQAITYLLVLLMVFSCIPSWSNPERVSAAGTFAGGDGSETNPYLISTADQLYEMRNYLGSYFELSNDIDLSDYDSMNSWQPIGEDAAPFTGGLDGNHYTISNLYVDTQFADFRLGLFGYMDNPKAIKNLNLRDVYVAGEYEVGALAGYVSNGIFENITVTGSVSGLQYRIGGLIGYSESSTLTDISVTGNVTGHDDTGGIAGYSYDNTVNNVYFDGSVTADHYYIGGQFGRFIDGTISNSGSRGTVSGHQYIGGLVGGLENSTVSQSYSHAKLTNTDDDMGGLIGNSMDSHIEHSYATGNVTGQDDLGGLVGYSEKTSIEYSYATGNVSGGDDVGGLVGDNEGGTISYSYATGDVVATDEFIGGLVGENEVADDGTDSIVQYSFATGNVTGDSEVGGIVGYNYGGIVRESYATGNVTGNVNVGGLVGDNIVGLVENSYSIGAVTGNTVVGGLVGSNAGGIIENSYYDTDTSGQADNQGTGLPSNDMKVIDSYVNWDFDSIWTLDDQNNGNPYLKRHRDLSGLSLSLNVALSPAFDKDVTSYTASVANSVGSIKVTPSTVAKNAKMIISINGGAPREINSGELSDALDLNVGENTITIVVALLDGVISKTYTVTVTRNQSLSYIPIPSSNANLEKIVFSEGLQLDPAFNPNILSYKANIESGMESIRVKPTLGDNQAKIDLRVNGVAYPVASGKESEDLPLVVGTNEIEITITASNGTVKVYHFTVEREQEAVVEYTCTFKDIENHWAKDDICEAARLKVIEGKDANHFAPNAAVTRAEFIAMILRALQMEELEESTDPVFTDHDRIPAWARTAIYTATDKGIIQGYSDGTLRPLESIDRTEMAAIIARTMNWQEGSHQTSAFSDEATIPGWAKGFAQMALEHGIITGRLNHAFAPFAKTTRAEAAIVMLRLRKHVEV
ncbi:GLUG motif-containing protein [Paenibacillus sp. PAMC21692]|uniref:GLUG motif-containing protein n=1 Tax=Paenibacillus sp. PAMC21692 TaxID=2762320 RepID=UPI00164D5CC9|nr:GLUG motif-containing protein [Paenibacillus sp. PAMC21692]QNK56924.1 S-layer homology domain-containing protein [Paenibacillus sp. PAMC21692]